jgi:hypothetical protein
MNQTRDENPLLSSMVTSKTSEYNCRIVLVDALVCEQFNKELGILRVKMIIDMIHMLHPFLCFCVDFKTSSTLGNMLILTFICCLGLDNDLDKLVIISQNNFI